MKNLKREEKGMIINSVLKCGFILVMFIVILVAFNYSHLRIDAAYKHAQNEVYPEYALGTTYQEVKTGDTVKGISLELADEFEKQGFDISSTDIYWMIRDMNEMHFSAEADCIEAGEILSVPYIYECGIWYN